MKTLKITTHWTAEEADCMVQLLNDVKAVVWENYGDEILEMHKAIRCEQQKREREEFNDEIPF